MTVAQCLLLGLISVHRRTLGGSAVIMYVVLLLHNPREWPGLPRKSLSSLCSKGSKVVFIVQTLSKDPLTRIIPNQSQMILRIYNFAQRRPRQNAGFCRSAV